MVGMPYPNMNTPELKEKMSFLNTHVGMIDGKQAGKNSAVTRIYEWTTETHLSRIFRFC